MELTNSVMEEFSFLFEENNNDVNNDDSVSLYSWCLKNGEYGKQILSEWSEKNTGNLGMKLDPRDVYDRDTRKYWWNCSVCGKEFYSQLYKRLHNHRGCPYCAPERWGKTRTEHDARSGISIRQYCNKVLYGSNILKEWDDDKNREMGYSIDSMPYCSNKTTFWTCSNCGKRYEKMTYSRVRLNQGCPDCGRSGTSLPEQLIYWSFKQIDPDTKNRYKINGIEYDIYVPKMNILIEYNGFYWHKDNGWKDVIKRENSKKLGHRFILIRESSTIQEDEYTLECITLRESSTEYEKKIQKAIDYIVKGYYDSTLEIDYRLAMDEAIKHLYLPIDNSVVERYPEILGEFDQEKNGAYRIESLTCGSNVRVVWKCSNCHSNWETRLAERVYGKRGCPRCGYNVFDGKIHKHAIKNPC